MKKALVTQTTDSFVFGTRLLLKSFFHFNEFDGDVIVMYGPGELSNKNISKLQKEFDIKFHECSVPNIAFKGRRNWAHNPASRFDIFKLPYDRVIYYDSDILITGDVSEFIDNKGDFVACAYTHKMMRESFKPNDTMADCNAHLFNAGVMSIGKKYLTEDVYNGLIKITKSHEWPGNQAILNKYFAHDCTLMSNIYNLTIGEVNRANLKRCKTLHFVGHKKVWDTGSYISKFDEGIIYTIGLANCTRILEKYRNHCNLLLIE